MGINLNVQNLHGNEVKELIIYNQNQPEAMDGKIEIERKCNMVLILKFIFK
jgi:hypothetical protein